MVPGGVFKSRWSWAHLCRAFLNLQTLLPVGAPPPHPVFSGVVPSRPRASVRGAVGAPQTEGEGGTVREARLAGRLPSPARTPSSAELTRALPSAWSAVPGDRRLVPSLPREARPPRREWPPPPAPSLPSPPRHVICHVSPRLAHGRAVSVRKGAQPSLVGHPPSPGLPATVPCPREAVPLTV